MSALEIEFNKYREKMNKVILSKNNLVMKGFGILIPIRTKMGHLIKEQKKCLGLWPVWYYVVMIVLNIIWENPMSLELIQKKCMKYSLLPTFDGTIVIPHVRRATEYWKN